MTNLELSFPTADNREPIEGNLWRQLDRWVNEGGRPRGTIDPTDKAKNARIGFRHATAHRTG